MEKQFQIIQRIPSDPTVNQAGSIALTPNGSPDAVYKEYSRITTDGRTAVLALLGCAAYTYGVKMSAIEIAPELKELL